MMWPRRLVLVFVAGALVACAGRTMTVGSEQAPDSASRVGQYRTYRVAPPVAGDVADRPDVMTSVAEALDEVLQAKGYQAASERADFLVRWRVTVKDREQVTTVDLFPSTGPGRMGGGPTQQTTMVREYQEGSLIIEIIDAPTDQTIWRGWAQAEIKPSARPEERREQIHTAVQKILARFPARR